jgi:hypothetical protein
MNCKEITDCLMCGEVYCRPREQPMAAGILTLDLTTDEPYVWLVKEPTGKYSDPGGMVDADIDLSHLDTVVRELREEQGRIISISQLEQLPYVVIGYNGKAYRCYINIIAKRQLSPITIGAVHELQTIRLPLYKLLAEYPVNIRRRLLTLLGATVRRVPVIPQPTLRDYLLSQV